VRRLAAAGGRKPPQAAPRKPRGRFHALPLALAALLLSSGVIVGALGAVAGYWVMQQDRHERFAQASYDIELAPTGPGNFQVLLPVPMGADGAVPGLTLRVMGGAPSFALVTTPHGLALSVRADAPVKLHAEGALPVRFSLDDVAAHFKQFSFWSFLDPAAQAPVLLKLEVRQRTHQADWELHVDAGKAIVVQQALDPKGWQVVRATQLFEVHAADGFGGGFPRVALGAATVSLASLYAPASLVVLAAVRPRRSS